MKEQLSILMTTYNGGKYLSQQLDSLLAQTFSEWTLYIRDDGSVDNTKDIISEYVNNDNRIHFIIDDKRRGALGGFMWLLQLIDSDYYMFCDQDDVWMEDKIELTIKKMSEQKDRETVPIIVCTDLKVVDSNLKIMYDSLWKQRNYSLSSINNKYFHLVYNNVTGCTMLINRKAKTISIPFPKTATVHDSWISSVVLWNNGRIIPISRATILYRQHSFNSIGTKPVPSFISQLKRVKSLMQKTKKEYAVASLLSNLGYFPFLLLKMYYMIKIHLKFNN